MNALLRITGVGKLISFYRYIYLDGPGVTRWSGVAIILLVGLIHLVKLPEHFEAAPYLGVLFAANVVGSAVAAFGIYRGTRTWGWLLGAVIAGVSLAAYLVSRVMGLPGLAEGAGAWDEPLGSAAMIVEAMFVLLYLSIATGANIAYPDRRDWRD